MHLSKFVRKHNVRGSTVFFKLFYGQFVGGVTLQEQENRTLMMGAQALLLPYQLLQQNSTTEEYAVEWEHKVTEFLNGLLPDDLEASWWTYETMVQETERDRQKVANLMLPLFIIIAVFAIVVSWTRNPLTSKPWLALTGTISAMLAIMTAVTLVMWCGLKFTSVVTFMPYIVFGKNHFYCFSLEKKLKN